LNAPLYEQKALWGQRPDGGGNKVENGEVTLLDLVKAVNELAGQALSKLDKIVGREIPEEEEKGMLEPESRVDEVERRLDSIRIQISEINFCLDRLNQRFGYPEEPQTVCKSGRTPKGA